MYGFTLIAVLAITGGAIAYIGDKLGTKVGKKKLSIFGLRPKHTSIVVTIITGILITGSTIGVLSLVSKDVRTALFGMEALAQKLSTLSQEVASKNIELDTSRVALESKNAEYAALTLKVKDTAERLRAISSELAEVIAQRDRTALELEQAKGDLDTSKQALTTLQETKNQLDLRVQSLNQSKVTLEKDVDRLNQLTTKLGEGIQVVREGSIIYRAGEILSTFTLPGGESKADTELALKEAIFTTNQGIIEKLGIENKNLGVLWIAQEEFDKVVAALEKHPEDVIVRISAGGNTVYGEPVIGQFGLFPNRLIYAQEETIYMSIIESGSKEEHPEQSVMAFLQKVNASAVEKGILPDPIQGTVGAINGADFYDAVNKVKRYSGKVMITATAKNDIYTAGPLKIELHVQEVSK
ncbi:MULTISPECIES: DUF3084 domain-containing protein [Pelosinus]|uniref:Chromosome partition protein Smc n=1 Tax=Pelosinus fermentans B4 TaxID=1149862 RepID=I9L6K1_9FIRM|nr:MULTISPECIES: DUF3084 domain-containing protein [Pelosinus]EIW15999.1 Protein of unknown function DUF3084 [Pelosinus fermentans B4]EIW27295.1 hypothetical protein FA11_1314 [Pelosinus fermentans A11]OAM92749.1 Protein of unknown function DUF3084 [Pelosinus fermentans DSM 17108]SDQ55707.1 Uncharacterized conserved protein, contains DUF3084 domain [Pelosinus fermentans]